MRLCGMGHFRTYDLVQVEITYKMREGVVFHQDLPIALPDTNLSSISHSLQSLLYHIRFPPLSTASRFYHNLLPHKMYAFNFFALLAAATIGSASPVAIEEPLQARQTTWTCPDFGKVYSSGADVIASQDPQNGLCCLWGLPYLQDKSRQSCCRNDPALLNDDTYKWSLECSSPYWKNITSVLDVRHCNLDPNYICKDECKNVPYLYPTPRDCPPKA